MIQISITRIIPQSYKRQLVLTKYLVGEAEPKNASKIIQAMLDDRSNDKLFLKRVRKMPDGNKVEVIVCEETNPDKEKKVAAIQNLIEKTKILSLPKEAPLTVEQYEQWSKIWPVNFIRQQVTRQITHKPEETKFLLTLRDKETNPFDYYFIKDQKILLSMGGKCEPGTINHPIMKMLQQWPQSQVFNANKDQWYYLTGISMYSRNSELCGMCSMALVHSRLARIYLEKQPSQNMDSIMSCPQLNHQITMFLLQ